MAFAQVVQTVPEQIAAQLRSEILSGSLQPQQPLREVQLAECFGVSRGRIRHVLQQLIQEGLLVAKPNCGAMVAPLPSEDVWGLLVPLRAQIETYALGLCFNDLDDGDLRSWDKLISRLRLACEEEDHVAILDRDFNFHRSILLRAGLEDVVPVWKYIMGRARGLYEQTHLKLDDLGEIYALHVALLDIFRSGDKEAAVRALYEHLTDGEFNEAFRRRYYESKEAIG